LAGWYGAAAVLATAGGEGPSSGVAAASAVTAFILAGVAAAAHRTEDDRARSTMVAAVGAVVVAQAAFRVGVAAGPEQATHLGLVLVGLGAFVAGRIFLPIAGLAAVCWLMVLPRFGGVGSAAHFSGFLVGSLALGGVLLLTRRYRDEVLEEARKVEDGLTEDLRVSLRWYKQLFQESPALMCVHDGNGRIEEVNPAGLRALGYPRQEVVGRNIMDFLVPVTPDGPRQYLRDIQRQGRTEGLLRARRADGSLRVWEYRSTILGNGPGDVVLATATDVTELAEAEDWVHPEADHRHE
jgi:PAS domain S-box-containing protein